MMAKMFYTLDETKAALGRNEEEIKQLAREGRLREFRDGPRLMFKADQVETLKAELGGGGAPLRDQIDLGPSDTGAPIGLVDSRGASATGISLADTDSSGRSSGSAPGMVLKDDTALAADLGLSGSVGGIPSPGRPGGSGLSGTASGTGSGSGLSGTRAGSIINVFSDTETGADPSAQTAINASVGDQVTLEGVGSGSGLLDLTRESDDTSLGAELLDEISPAGGSRAASGTGIASGTAAGTAAGRTGVAAAVRGAARVPAGTVVQVEAADPSAAAFGAMALAGVLVCLIGAVALFAGVKDVRPGLLEMVSGWSFLILAGAGVGLALVFAVFGLIIGRAGAR
jgi:hypothetical protein